MNKENLNKLMLEVKPIFIGKQVKGYFMEVDTFLFILNELSQEPSKNP